MLEPTSYINQKFSEIKTIFSIPDFLSIEKSICFIIITCCIRHNCISYNQIKFDKK
jgi:hypothetical protein